MIFGLSHIVYACDHLNYKVINELLISNGYYISFKEKKIVNKDVYEFVSDKNNIISDMIFYKKGKNPSIEVVLYKTVLKEKATFKLSFNGEELKIKSFYNNINSVKSFYQNLTFDMSFFLDNTTIKINSIAPTMKMDINYEKSNLEMKGIGYLDNLGVNCISLLVSTIEDKYKILKELEEVKLTILFKKKINNKILKVFFCKNTLNNEIIEFVEYERK
ncbi:MAG: hypothetical protein ACNI28_05420 [Arcobacter sp.]|uniref:hypothetical protein n=1 Tax=Arcobacter sp. TaxID=1872629 RepID=UPI003B008793